MALIFLRRAYRAQAKELTNRIEEVEQERDEAIAEAAIVESRRIVKVEHKRAEQAEARLQQLESALRTLANPRLEEHESSAYVRRMADYARSALSEQSRGEDD